MDVLRLIIHRFVIGTGRILPCGTARIWATTLLFVGLHRPYVDGENERLVAVTEGAVTSSTKISVRSWSHPTDVYGYPQM